MSAFDEWAKLSKDVANGVADEVALDSFRIDLDVAHRSMAMEEINNAATRHLNQLAYFEREVVAVERIAQHLGDIAETLALIAGNHAKGIG